MEEQSSKPAQTDTGGGAYIGKDVNAGRDVAGRDIVHHVNNYFAAPLNEENKRGCLKIVIIIGCILILILPSFIAFMPVEKPEPGIDLSGGHYPPVANASTDDQIMFLTVLIIILMLIVLSSATYLFVTRKRV